MIRSDEPSVPAIPAPRLKLTALMARELPRLRTCRRQRLFEVIHGAQLHGLEIAVHLQATRQHHHRCVPVACQNKLHEVVRFKSRAALIHNDEVEVLALQAPLRLSVFHKSPDRVTHAAQQRDEILQVFRILINQQDPSTGDGRLGWMEM